MTLSGRALLFQNESEDRWLAQVMRWAERGGWLCYHTHDSRRSTAGFPDLVLVRDKQIIFAELKRGRGGRVSDAQATWLAALAKVEHVTSVVWLPMDEASVRVILTGR